MSCYPSFIFLFFFSYLTSFRVCAQNHTYVYHDCPDTKTFTRNSTFSTNLQTLLSSLSSRNASYSTGFQTATAGQSPDRVTGLFLCRGDLSPEVCRSCVAFSVKDASNRCPNERQAWVYYDECMLRYSDQNILSTLMIYGGAIFTLENQIASNKQDQFRDFVLSTMNQAAKEALSSSRKFDAA